MAEVQIVIGGRPFSVACREGEERFLLAAAQILDAEAQPLVAQGRLPEARMLLMAGLMLADRTAALQDEIALLKDRLAQAEACPAPAPERIEVPVIAPQVVETLAELAARAEALADQIEDRAG
ncbi:MAG: cell division protein ZapA [Rhodobacterales bacterium]|nr:cell division protein ZapA [Rhodobacterales bacterium]